MSNDDDVVMMTPRELDRAIIVAARREARRNPNPALCHGPDEDEPVLRVDKTHTPAPHKPDDIGLWKRSEHLKCLRGDRMATISPDYVHGPTWDAAAAASNHEPVISLSTVPVDHRGTYKKRAAVRTARRAEMEAA